MKESHIPSVSFSCPNGKTSPIFQYSNPIFKSNSFIFNLSNNIYSKKSLISLSGHCNEKLDIGVSVWKSIADATISFVL